MKAVAACHVIAGELMRDAGQLVTQSWMRRVEIQRLHVADVEQNVPARVEARLHEVAYDLVLRINRDGTSSGEFREIDAMSRAVEQKVDALVDEALADHAVTETAFAQQIDRTLLQHTGAKRRFDLRATPCFEN